MIKTESIKNLINSTEPTCSIEELSDRLMQKHIDQYNKATGELTGYDCPKCLNRGYIASVRNGNEVYKECKCMKIRKTLRRIEKSGLSDVLKNYTFESYKTPHDWQKHVKETAESFTSGWFFFGGQVGCGKSHICTAIVGRLLESGKSALYMMWRDDVTKLKSMVMDDEYGEEISNFKTVDVLYIDDFFKTEEGKRPTTGDINVAFEILNFRYANNLTTIISSERSIEGIIEIDEAVGSRIYQKTKDFCLTIGKDKSKNYRLGGQNA